MKLNVFNNVVILLQNGSRYYFRHVNLRGISSTAEQIKSFKDIPGLSTLPVIGSLHHFLPGIGTIGPKGNFFELLDVFYKKFGPVVKMEGILARASMVILYEPEHFDQVYRAEEVNPLRPGFDSVVYYRNVLRKDTFKGVHGLTIAQGPQWREFRTKVNPALLKPKLVKLYAPGLEEIAHDMVARVIQLQNNEDYLQHNLDLEITKWSLESVALVGLGARLGCLQDNLSDNHPARQLIKSVGDIMKLAFKVEFIPNPWKYIATPSYNKLMKNLDLQWEISKMYIEQAQSKIKERQQDVPEEDKSIIEKLLAIDEKVAIMMANEMLMAGIDTVAFTTTNLLYQLATNQTAQDKLRAEIRSGTTPRRYLRACLKEALRLWAVIPGNLRRTSKEHVVAGYRIPAGVDVVAPNEYLCRMEKYYPRGKEFLPERWLAEKTDPLYYGNAHPMVNAPFGFGVRSCIGRRIAELEIEILIVKLLGKYKVTWNGPPIKVVTKIMNSFAKPYHFKFEAVE